MPCKRPGMSFVRDGLLGEGMRQSAFTPTFGSIQPQRSLKSFITSYSIQVLVVILLIEISMLQPVKVLTKRAYESIALTTTEAAPKVRHVKPSPRPRPQPPQVKMV